MMIHPFGLYTRHGMTKNDRLGLENVFNELFKTDLKVCFILSRKSILTVFKRRPTFKIFQK